MLCISYSLLFTNLLTSLAEENKLGPPPPAGVEDNAPRPPVLYLSVAQVRNHYSEYLNLPSESQVSHKTQSYRSAEQKQPDLSIFDYKFAAWIHSNVEREFIPTLKEQRRTAANKVF